MGPLLAVVALAQFPVGLPAQRGHLRVLSSQVTDRGVEVALEYTNDTGALVSKAAVECAVLDHREAIVADAAEVLPNLAPGANARVTVVVVDRTSRGRRAECVVSRATLTPDSSSRAPAVEPAPVTPAPAGPAAPASQNDSRCCVRCREGDKACGDVCVPWNQRCKKAPGCACNAENQE